MNDIQDLLNQEGQGTLSKQFFSLAVLTTVAHLRAMRVCAAGCGHEKSPWQGLGDYLICVY